MSDDGYLAYRTWTIRSVGTTASTVEATDTGTPIATEIATLYVLQDIRSLLSNFIDLWSADMIERRNRL